MPRAATSVNESASLLEQKDTATSGLYIDEIEAGEKPVRRSVATTRSSLRPSFHAVEQPNAFDRFVQNLLPPGSIASSCFNLVSATLGAGTLGLPWAVNACGSAFGAVALIVCGAVTVYTIYLLILTLEATGCSTYEALSRKLVGPKLEKFTAALIVLFCWGVACAYVVALGTILAPIQTFSWSPQGPWGKRALVCIFWVCCMLPLSLLREVNSLRYASLIGMFSSVFLVVVICIHAGIDAPNDKGNLHAIQDMGLNFLSALTVFSFSYCCQTNAFEIYHELQDPTPKRMTRAGIWAATICTSLYIIAGIAGSADFGANVASNILNNYENPQKTPYVMAAFVAICITVTTAFPICIFPTRDAVLQVMGYATVYDTPPRVRIGVSSFLAFTALLLGLFVPNIQVMFSVLGGVCGSLLGYCLPVIFAYRAGVLTLEKSGPIKFGIGVAVCVGGGICGIVGTFTSIYSTIKGNGSSSSPAPGFNNSTNTSMNMSLFF